MALLLAWLLTRLLPVRWWLRLFRTGAEPFREAEPARCEATGPSVTRKVGRIVGKVVRYLPFRMRCLPQAMAAQWMLRRRGVPSVLVFGVRRSADADRRLEYHAWLTADEGCVVGGDEAESYTAFPPFAVTGSDR